MLVRSAFTESILSLIVAAAFVLTITFTVILLAPTPEPPVISVSDVAEVHTNPDLASQRGLVKLTSDVEPSFADDEGLVRQLIFEIILATTLAIEPADVRVFGPKSATVGQLNVTINDDENSSNSTEPNALIPFSGSEKNSNSQILANVARLKSSNLLETLAGLKTRSMEAAAILSPSGEWAVYKRENIFWTGWRLHALLAFGLSMIALLPIAWLAGNRLSQPLRDLAKLADGSQLGQDLKPEPFGGPKEIRAAADALVNMHGRLKADAAQRTRVVAALAHDLRTPLTSLRVRIETVAQGQTLAKMTFDIHRMEQMIQDMMLYAKGIDKAPTKARLDLQRIVARCLDDVNMKSTINRSGTIESIWVWGHGLSIQRAIHNLLENAIKYGTHPGIRVAKKGNRAQIVVSNHCEYLVESDLTRLLEPFERGEQSRNRDTGGMGLGLSIAHDIARFHRGSLSIRNVDGGVEVILDLPLVDKRD